MRMPQVRKRWRQTGVMSSSLLALTMALSKLSEISSAASTEPTAAIPALEYFVLLPGR